MDDFDSVSWQNDSEPTALKGPDILNNEGEVGSSRPVSKSVRRSSSIQQQAGGNADAVDLGGIGDGRLDCTVDTPLKESDGTKDAYVSYLVTTYVRSAEVLHGNIPFIADPNL